MPKKGSALTLQTIELAPERRLVRKIADPQLPFGGSWTYELTPTADGCILQITENGEIYNPVFRFMARFVLGYTRSIEGYLDSLERRLAGAAAA